MKKDRTLEAWRNADAFDALSAEERATLQASPAPALDLDDDVLGSITGGCHFSVFPTNTCTNCGQLQCAA